VAVGTPVFFLGNLGFATFLAIGVLILVFIAFFNTEFE
jgi:preprotein translocase subunit SecD